MNSGVAVIRRGPSRRSLRVVDSEVTELQAQFARAEALRHSLGHGAYVLDENGALVDMNAGAEEILGWTADELRGRNMHQAVHYLRSDGSPFPGDECPLLGVLESGVDFGETHDTFVAKGGSIIPVAYVSSPVIVDDEIVGAVLAFWPR
jgi:PAS domain S-box-containing protein